MVAMSKAARLYHDRQQAGKVLARALAACRLGPTPIVLGLPRGGVPVAFAVAHALRLPLDILLVRKLGMPGHEEFAMGAVGSGGVRVINPAALHSRRITPGTLEAVCERELARIAERERRYRGERPAPPLKGRGVILVDDGIATGSTMQAAVAVARAADAARIVVAAPVGAPDSCAALAHAADQVLCPQQPAAFHAVSQWYRQFDQTGDDEVLALLQRAWHNAPEANAAVSHSS